MTTSNSINVNPDFRDEEDERIMEDLAPNDEGKRHNDGWLHGRCEGAVTMIGGGGANPRRGSK
jgi:hypothetical protein